MGVSRRKILNHPPIRGFDKAIFVNPGKAGQTANQADVWTFRGLDWANTNVMRMVYVAHVKAGALAAQTARSKGRKCAFVAQLSQRVGLIHKLGQLARAKELAQRRHHRTDVNQADRRELVLIANGHTLFNDTLHPAQANTQLVLDQLTHSLDTPVAQMIDVIRTFDAVIDQDHAPYQPDDIPFGHITVWDRDEVLQVKFLVEFVSANFFQVIMALVKKLFLKELARIIQGSRVARAHAFEELEQRRHRHCLAVGSVPNRLLVDRRSNIHAFGIVIHILEE